MLPSGAAPFLRAVAVGIAHQTSLSKMSSEICGVSVSSQYNSKPFVNIFWFLSCAGQLTFCIKTGGKSPLALKDNCSVSIEHYGLRGRMYFTIC